jgi:phosphatidylserine decarboxylase
MALVFFVLFLTLFFIHVLEDNFFYNRPGREKSLFFSLARSLPMRSYSKAVGLVGAISLPYPLNVIMLAPVWFILKINLQEARRKELGMYRSINDLFSREIDMRQRTVEEGRITSPVDGKIMYMGKAGDTTGLIKGVDYDTSEFLNVNGYRSLLQNPENDLYQVVIYLAPSNYHRFHSFTEMSLSQIKHIPGVLLSVGRWPMRHITGLLQMNERVVFMGTGPNGQHVSLVAVGSTGVGSIETPFAKLRTNRYFDDGMVRVYETGAWVKKGEELGKFNLGSTVVIYFECRPGSPVIFSRSSEDDVLLGDILVR